MPTVTAMSVTEQVHGNHATAEEYEEPVFCEPLHDVIFLFEVVEMGGWDDLSDFAARKRS